ncbi:MAG: hypothetical protein ABGY24_15240, partial [bacterium]
MIRARAPCASSRPARRAQVSIARRIRASSSSGSSASTAGPRTSNAGNSSGASRPGGPSGPGGPGGQRRRSSTRTTTAQDPQVVLRQLGELQKLAEEAARLAI